MKSAAETSSVVKVPLIRLANYLVPKADILCCGKKLFDHLVGAAEQRDRYRYARRFRR
jgi:hypothetical protein